MESDHKMNFTDKEAKGTSKEDEQPVFYRCICPECGEDELELINTGVFERSSVFGITSEGEIGGSRTEVDGDDELGMFCRECQHQVRTDYSENESCSGSNLIQWAKSNGEIQRILPFTCPACDSQELSLVEKGIETVQAVVAVCEPVSPGDDPLVALSHRRELWGGGCRRYSCHRGHELAKDDGTPVSTDQELLDWLKARHSVGNE